jgi:C-terminal processing protease CtpA/Prc
VPRADDSTASFTLRRAVLKAGEAEARLVTRADGRRVGVLKLSTFSAAAASGGGGSGGGGGGTYESMERVLAAEPLASAEELLIDLRGNLGGHFPSGVAAAKLFLPADATVVATVDRTGKPCVLRTARTDGPRSKRVVPPREPHSSPLAHLAHLAPPRAPRAPLAPSAPAAPMLTFEAGKYANTRRPTYILVDRGTASAAEVLATELHMHRTCTACACGMCMCMLHVHVACACCMCMLHVHVACACCMCMLHVHRVWVQVFAAALQENRAAKVVGEQTYGEPSRHLHATCPLLPLRCTCTRSLLCALPSLRPAGKGLVQSIQKLTDGSAVVLTVAKYRTPRGNDINGKGVTPNLSVTCETGADAVSCLDAALTKG